MTEQNSERFPKIRIVGGPDPASLEIYRNGERCWTVTEFQINGSLENPVTATFREIVQFDGVIEVMPQRKSDLSTH